MRSLHDAAIHLQEAEPVQAEPAESAESAEPAESVQDDALHDAAYEGKVDTVK